MSQINQIQPGGNQGIRMLAREAMTSVVLRMLARQEASGMVRCLLEHPSDVKAAATYSRLDLRNIRKSANARKASPALSTGQTRLRALPRRQAKSGETVEIMSVDKIVDDAIQTVVHSFSPLSLFPTVEHNTQAHEAEDVTEDITSSLTSDTSSDITQITLTHDTVQPDPAFLKMPQVVDTQVSSFEAWAMGAEAALLETQDEDIQDLDDQEIEVESSLQEVCVASHVEAIFQALLPPPSVPVVVETVAVEVLDVCAAQEIEGTADVQDDETKEREAEAAELNRVMAALSRMGQDGADGKINPGNGRVSGHSRFRMGSKVERVIVPTRLRGTREVVVEHMSIPRVVETRITHSHPNPLSSMTDELLVASKKIETGPQEALRVRNMVEKVRRSLSEMDFRIQAVLGRPRSFLG